MKIEDSPKIAYKPVDWHFGLVLIPEDEGRLVSCLAVGWGAVAGNSNLK